MQRPVCLADFELHFNNSLDKSARDYYSLGASQQQTLKDNVEAFMRYMYVYNTAIYVYVIIAEAFGPLQFRSQRFGF